MSFKDDVAADIDTFLELEEFGEEIVIDGVKLIGVISTYTQEKSARMTETFEGLHGDWQEIYFRTEDYCAVKKFLPKHGDWTIINGKRYDVLTSADQSGIAKIICAAYRQNSLR